MRIALLSTPFVPVPPPRYGGTELIVAALAEGLTRRGHSVTLYTTGETGVSGVERRALYEQPVWPPDPHVELNHTAFALEDVLARGDVDLVHAHTPAALAFARFLDLPMVYTIHNTRVDVLADLARCHATRSLRIVAISRRQRELHPELEARVIHHGLDPGRYTLGAGDGGYVAFLGRFAREKGPHAAIDAARRAGVEIRLAGRPHLPKDAAYHDTELRPRLAKAGVRWEGEADHPAKLALLGGALATLFPIDWEEPFGLVMIESMLCGTPVVAFPRGSAPEIVDEGVTGWIVADVAEMARVVLGLAHGRLAFDRARCRAHAAERFAVDRMVDAYEALYHEARGEAPAASLVV